MRFLRRIGVGILTMGVLAGVGGIGAGCKRESNASSQSAPTPPKATAAPAAPTQTASPNPAVPLAVASADEAGPAVRSPEPKPNAPAVSTDTQSALEAVFRTVYCGQQRRGPSPLESVYRTHDFDDAAAFAAAWKAARDAAPEWAERAMAEVLSGDCAAKP